MRREALKRSMPKKLARNCVRVVRPIRLIIAIMLNACCCTNTVFSFVQYLFPFCTGYVPSATGSIGRAGLIFTGYQRTEIFQNNSYYLVPYLPVVHN